MHSAKEQLVTFWYEGQKDLLENNRIIYKYIEADAGLKILENCSLAFRNPLFFNDPYDFTLKLFDFSNIPEESIKKMVYATYNFLSKKDKRKLWEAGKATLMSNLGGELERLMKIDIEHYGVSCFSAEYDNLLMWSHYAKSHTGICIGFDLVELFYIISKDSHPERIVRKVIYQDKILPMKYAENRQEATIRWMTTKAKVWEYEKEIRIILNFLKLNNDHLHFQKINTESFLAIYLGTQILPLQEEKIRAICKNLYPNLKIYKMKLAGDEFRLIAF